MALSFSTIVTCSSDELQCAAVRSDRNHAVVPQKPDETGHDERTVTLVPLGSEENVRGISTARGLPGRLQ